MTITFNVGQTYSDRSICDHNCIFSFTILAPHRQDRDGGSVGADREARLVDL